MQWKHYKGKAGGKSGYAEIPREGWRAIASCAYARWRDADTRIISKASASQMLILLRVNNANTIPLRCCRARLACTSANSVGIRNRHGSIFIFVRLENCHVSVSSIYTVAVGPRVHKNARFFGRATGRIVVDRKPIPLGVCPHGVCGPIRERDVSCPGYQCANSIDALFCSRETATEHQCRSDNCCNQVRASSHEYSPERVSGR